MSNPILNGGVASLQSIYEVYQPGGTAPGHHRVGTRAYLEDGRVFYYAAHSLSTTLAESLVYGASADVANHQNVTATATAAQASATIALGATAATENQYRDGIFLIDTATLGINQARKIKSHPASAGSETITVQLYDAWNTTATGTVTGSLKKNPFRDLVKFTGASQANVPIGVPQVTVPAGNTNTQYFWIQTQGWCPVSAEGSITIGVPVTVATAATSDAGQVKAAVDSGTSAAAFDSLPLIGYCLVPNGTDEHCIVVDLCIKG